MSTPAEGLVHLIGFRGSGKSRVARELGARLGWEVIDIDQVIQESTSRSIAEIFRDRGEEGFRDLEERALAEACAGSGPTVVATGGGCVVRPANVKLLRSTGVVVWLEISPAESRRRLAADPASPSQRPPLRDGDALLEIEEVLGRRIPLYAAACHLRVPTDGRMVPEIVATIMQDLASRSR
jgi:shikimate kinase